MGRIRPTGHSLPTPDREPDAVTVWHGDNEDHITVQPLSLTTSSGAAPVHLLNPAHWNGPEPRPVMFWIRSSVSHHLEPGCASLWNSQWGKRPFNSFLEFNPGSQCRLFKLDRVLLVEPDPSGAEEDWNRWSREAGLHEMQFVQQMHAVDVYCPIYRSEMSWHPFVSSSLHF